jgi:hypothetical protein
MAQLHLPTDVLGDTENRPGKGFDVSFLLVQVWDVLDDHHCGGPPLGQFVNENGNEFPRDIKPSDLGPIRAPRTEVDHLAVVEHHAEPPEAENEVFCRPAIPTACEPRQRDPCDGSLRTM